MILQELAELAMGTYKHIGRLRSARLVGKEVASFYMLLGETQKAAAFLGDALRTFEEDGWHELAAQAQLELAECYRKAGDTRKFVKLCIGICAAPEIDTLLRWSYFDEMNRSLESLSKPTLIVPFEKVIEIVSVSVKNADNVIMQYSDIELELVVDSNFPREVLCSDVLVSLEPDTRDHSKKSNKNKSANCRILTSKDLKTEDPSMQKLRIQRHLDYRQDKQLSSASVVCRYTLLKRKDSAAAATAVALPQHCDFSNALEVTKLVNISP